MAGNFNHLLESLSRKAMLLTERYNAEVQARAAAESEAAELRLRISALEEELRLARLDIDYLSVSYRIAKSPDEIVKSRRLISRMIRDIDKCVTQLKE